MTSDIADLLSLRTATGRWARLGPYYAMFPVDFAFQVVQDFSAPEGAVLDPFAGRASSIYAAAVQNRVSVGVEINPVGWLYGRVKLRPASKPRVLARVSEIAGLAESLGQHEDESLPEFFSMCFAPRVLRYLLAARTVLQWKTSIVDATVMAFILVYLHGKQGEALSNQMRQGKAMSPDYSVRWWKDRRMSPPDISPCEFLHQRIEWRYLYGTPRLSGSSLMLADSRGAVRRLIRQVATGERKPFDLLFTSPPYYAITNYHYDQWLRLWMLGGSYRPTRLAGSCQGKFESRDGYRTLLRDVFGQSAEAMSPTAMIYVRTDARQFTFQTTLNVLHEAFPHKSVEIVQRPFHKSTQTALFGDKSSKPGEIDIILR